VLDELDAVRCALADLRPNDVVALCVDDSQATWELVQQRQRQQHRRAS
jgi:hypothetical protein